VTRRVIFHISANDFPLLGTPHHTRAIWDELSRGADAYHVIARGQDNSWHHEQEGILHLHRLPAFGRGQMSFLFTQWLILILFMKYRPTHMLAQCPVLGGLVAALWARLARVPLLVELHGTHYFSSDRPGFIGGARHIFYSIMARPAFAAAKHIRTLSREMTQLLGVCFGSSIATKAVIIPPRVNLSLFAAKTDYSSNNRLRLISVGGLVTNKNHGALLDDLAAIGLPVEITLVGSGPLEASYRARTDSLSDAGVILHLAGQLDHADLAQRLRVSDIYVHYSVAEGVPRAILEAMAVGLPVITAPAGYLSDVIQAGRNGIILAAHGKEPLKAALMDLQDSASRATMGRAARRIIETAFEWHTVFAAYRAALYGGPLPKAAWE
jgi:glycosyltransferase involved in cell wall biosynthesis